MTPSLSVVLRALLERDPTPAELDLVTRAAVREAVSAVVGEPEERGTCAGTVGDMPCTREPGHKPPCWHETPIMWGRP